MNLEPALFSAGSCFFSGFVIYFFCSILFSFFLLFHSLALSRQKLPGKEKEKLVSKKLYYKKMLVLFSFVE